MSAYYSYLAKILGRVEEPEPTLANRQARKTVFPGGPLMTLTEGNYYLVAVLEPEHQMAVMRHQHWVGSTDRTYWEPYMPRGMTPGNALVIPLVDLGSEVEF